MQCPECQHENPEGSRFCNACGAKLEAECPGCGHVNPPGSRFCNTCGHDLAVASQPAQTADAPEVQPTQAEPPSREPLTPEVERRQLTVMFSDLVDSTKLSGQLDPEDYREVLRAYQQTCSEIIQRFDGYIAQHLGDALLVYFGFPTAHEDDAQRAIYTGLGMLEAMGSLNERLKQDKGIRLAIRMGIHTGITVVGDIGEGEKHEMLALLRCLGKADRLRKGC